MCTLLLTLAHGLPSFGGVSTLLIVLLIIVLVGALPHYPYSEEWGYGPSGAVGIVLTILIVLLLLGRI